MAWRNLFLGMAFAMALCQPTRAEELLVIVNPLVEVDSLSAPEIASIYLMKLTMWPDGTPVGPVTRETTSEARAKFTGQVLKQNNAALAAYWNEMHFKGHLPPLVQESDQSVLAFVQKVPGSIGYIQATSALANVKVVGRLP